MPRPTASLLLVVTLLLFTAAARAQPTGPAAGSAAVDDSLTQAIQSLIDAPALTNATWGIVVMDEATGRVRVSIGGDRSLVPASNAKLLTTAAALDVLGPDYRYATRLYAGGPLEGSTLQGPLVLRGSGDPTLGYAADGVISERIDPTALFQGWAEAVRRRGITQIAGGIVGDDNVFDDESLGAGWTWDDTPYGYSAEVSGLSYAHNFIDLRVRGQAPGEPGLVSWSPGTDYVEIVNQSVTRRQGLPKKERYRRRLGTNTIVVQAEVPAGSVEREDLAISNPTAFAVHVLRATLLEQGVGVQGPVLDVDDLAFPPRYPDDDSASGLQLLLTHLSPRVAAIVAKTNTESQNLYAEQLLRTLGVVVRPPDDVSGPAGGSAERGAQIVKETLARAGADTSQVRVADGSGLSRLNLVTPEALTALLRYMAQHPQAGVAEAFRGSLPVGGRDGTLSYRFRGDAPAAGRVRAKTGTLTGVSALSGYVQTAGGTPLVFAIVCNNHTTKGRVVRRVQDAIVNRLASLPD